MLAGNGMTLLLRIFKIFLQEHEKFFRALKSVQLYTLIWFSSIFYKTKGCTIHFLERKTGVALPKSFFRRREIFNLFSRDREKCVKSDTRTFQLVVERAIKFALPSRTLWKQKLGHFFANSNTRFEIIGCNAAIYPRAEGPFWPKMTRTRLKTT